MRIIFRIMLTASLVWVMINLSSCYKKFDPKTYQPPLSIGGFTSSKEIAPNNLIAFFAFDGSLIDSISGTAATNSGTSFTGGFKKQALQTTGNSYALFTPGSSILNMNSFTITYWVNAPVNTTGIAGTVNLSHNSNFWGNIDMFFENGSTLDAAKFRVHIQNGNGREHWIAKDGIPSVFTKWTNLAVSFDNATKTFKFYVNGQPVVTNVDAAFGDLQFTNAGKIVFGTVQFMTNPSLTSSHGAEPWASYLNGMLDEVRIYNKALTDNEVNSLVKLEGRGK